MQDTTMKGHLQRELITSVEEFLIVISYKQGSVHYCDQSSKLGLLKGCIIKQCCVIRQHDLEAFKYYSGRWNGKPLATSLLSVKSLIL